VLWGAAELKEKAQTRKRREGHVPGKTGDSGESCVRRSKGGSYSPCPRIPSKTLSHKILEILHREVGKTKTSKKEGHPKEKCASRVKDSTKQRREKKKRDITARNVIGTGSTVSEFDDQSVGEGK